MNSQRLLRRVDNNVLNRMMREDIFGDTEEPVAVDGIQSIRRDEAQIGDIDDPVQAQNQPVPEQQRRPEVSSESEINELVRQLGKTRVPLGNEFSLPEPEESTNFVDLIRKANANFEYQSNLFNTRF